jgi:hypothetical protein
MEDYEYVNLLNDPEYYINDIFGELKRRIYLTVEKSRLSQDLPFPVDFPYTQYPRIYYAYLNLQISNPEKRETQLVKCLNEIKQRHLNYFNKIHIISNKIEVIQDTIMCWRRYHVPENTLLIWFEDYEETLDELTHEKYSWQDNINSHTNLYLQTIISFPKIDKFNYYCPQLKTIASHEFYLKELTLQCAQIKNINGLSSKTLQILVLDRCFKLEELDNLNFPNLKKLCIYNCNNFKCFKSYAFKQVDKLKILHVSNCPFFWVIENSFYNLKNVEEIEFATNKQIPKSERDHLSVHLKRNGIDQYYEILYRKTKINSRFKYKSVIKMRKKLIKQLYYLCLVLKLNVKQ